ncbi:DUF1292 domain-containing protein [Paenibacillus sp. GCM10027627]|uniref:DUF1292 domain-containing protein n=1 Tax=unclassified Paenibacillus TaxID=185978 RepID=UPI00362E27FF
MTEGLNHTPERLSRLQELFGGEVELVAEDGTTELYSIKAEFQLGDVQYIALQSESMRSEDEVELLRVLIGDGEPQLESIDDDEEWEAASEAYDDLLFANDERP